MRKKKKQGGRLPTLVLNSLSFWSVNLTSGAGSRVEGLGVGLGFMSSRD